MPNSHPSVNSFRNPLRLIFNSSIFLFVFLLILYIASRVFYQDDISVTNEIKIICFGVFEFVRPFLQLVIVLAILEWILNRLGFSLENVSSRFEWNVQTIIALIVIIAFSIAALAGMSGADALKDLALVVVGFYFGTQKRISEVATGENKTTITEDHTNERGTESGK